MFCLLPVVIGIIDAWYWLMLGNKLSHIEWDASRIWAAWGFLFPAFGLIAAAAMMELENGK
jgi:flagellar motor component MotA